MVLRIVSSMVDTKPMRASSMPSLALTHNASGPVTTPLKAFLLLASSTHLFSASNCSSVKSSPTPSEKSEKSSLSPPPSSSPPPPPPMSSSPPLVSSSSSSSFASSPPLMSSSAFSPPSTSSPSSSSSLTSSSLLASVSSSLSFAPEYSPPSTSSSSSLASASSPSLSNCCTWAVGTVLDGHLLELDLWPALTEAGWPLLLHNLQCLMVFFLPPCLDRGRWPLLTVLFTPFLLCLFSWLCGSISLPYRTLQLSNAVALTQTGSSPNLAAPRRFVNSTIDAAASLVFWPVEDAT
mmetsp:Transcript_10807/g.16304  ORF Transcript_10807/g.16304 Transcript_10807/m.16304 type:complete len:293 (+) Transcript_10807:385-1263(+)